ncbi:MAG: methyltransferase family protein [Acidithiobacillus ferrivorans]
MNASMHSMSGIKVPPPVIYASAFLVGIELNILWPTSPMSTFWSFAIGTALILASILIMPPVLVRFRRAGTPFDVRKVASALITDGLYRFSRNPSYVSLTMLYMGLWIALNNAWILLLTVPILFIMNLWVIRREERHMEEQFGEYYLEYKSTVRSWL